MTDVGRLLTRLRRFRSPIFTGLAMLFVCLFIVALDPGPLTALRHVLFDGYQRVMPRDRKFAGAIVVAIDETALQSRGQWPWPRAQVAELLDSIGRARPLAIGVDILFSEPERAGGDGDAALARAVKANGAVLGVACPCCSATWRTSRFCAFNRRPVCSKPRQCLSRGRREAGGAAPFAIDNMRP